MKSILRDNIAERITESHRIGGSARFVGHGLYIAGRSAGHGLSVSFFDEFSRRAERKIKAVRLTYRPSAGLLTAHVKKSKEGIVVFETDEDAKSLLEIWIQKKNAPKNSGVMGEGAGVRLE